METPHSFLRIEHRFLYRSFHRNDERILSHRLRNAAEKLRQDVVELHLETPPLC